MQIKPVLSWRQFWMGARWSKRNHALYLLPIPCIGLKFEFDVWEPYH